MLITFLKTAILIYFSLLHRILAYSVTSPPFDFVSCDFQVRNRAIEAGALRALEAGIVSGDDDASLHCLKALFSATADMSFLAIIAR